MKNLLKETILGTCIQFFPGHRKLLTPYHPARSYDTDVCSPTPLLVPISHHCSRHWLDIMQELQVLITGNLSKFTYEWRINGSFFGESLNPHLVSFIRSKLCFSFFVCFWSLLFGTPLRQHWKPVGFIKYSWEFISSNSLQCLLCNCEGYSWWAGKRDLERKIDILFFFYLLYLKLKVFEQRSTDLFRKSQVFSPCDRNHLFITGS